MAKKIIIKKIIVGELQTNCYIVACPKKKEAVLIDPGADADNIKLLIKQLKLNLKNIALTHAHIDHINAIDAFDVPVYVHKLDREFLQDKEKNLSAMFGGKIFHPKQIRELTDKSELAVGDLRLEVIHTPGHTPGSICLNVEYNLFSGDTLFYQGLGRTDLPGGNFDTLVSAIKTKLFTLNANTIVWPGHGPKTTIGDELKENPFLCCV